jgi:hypothetical protein
MNRRYDPSPGEVIVSVAVMFTVEFRWDEERGGYVPTRPVLPEVTAYGKTLRQARSDAQG